MNTSLQYLIFYAASLWLGCALWLAYDGDPIWLWMGMMPAVYIALLALLRE